MTINEVLELKNVPAQNEWPSTYEDFAKIFWKLKGIRLEQERKESFWSATNENLKKAYDQLEHQEQELERAYGQIQRYLENIKEGLLLIDRDYVIQDQYSVYLRDLFNTDRIEGRNLVDFLYPNQETQSAEREELGGFLDILFSSKNASIQMISDVNPLVGRVIAVGDSQIERRAIDASFTRIMGDDGVESVMVIFENRTHEIDMERKLELEETRHESELETIAAILKNGPAALLDFITESAQLIESLKQNWSNLSDASLRTELFKQVHSLKGVSKYFELNHVSGLAHGLEELISAAEAGDTVDKNRFYGTIEQLENDLSGIRALNEKLMQFADTLAGQTEGNAPSRFFESLREMVMKLGDELDKQVQVTVNNQCDTIPYFSRLQKPIIHLARNAVDHGIEDPYHRLSNQKAMRGSVEITAKMEAGNCIVDVIDDGAGIDFQGIARKAISLGIIPEGATPSQADLLRLIFSPRFSSHVDSTEISGRGLGLDIVRDTVKELGGKVTVATAPNRGTRFRITLPA